MLITIKRGLRDALLCAEVATTVAITEVALFGGYEAVTPTPFDPFDNKGVVDYLCWARRACRQAHNRPYRKFRREIAAKRTIDVHEQEIPDDPPTPPLDSELTRTQQPLQSCVLGRAVEAPLK
ncbi:MAG: hypothetical protein GX621_18285 [Pirellulaceae bacterium]|nr:hypothetical protein [Pirellulaceae bacterium]